MWNIILQGHSTVRTLNGSGWDTSVPTIVAFVFRNRIPLINGAFKRNAVQISSVLEGLVSNDSNIIWNSYICKA